MLCNEPEGYNLDNQEKLQEQLDAKDLIIQNKQRELDETILRMEKLQEKVEYLEQQNLLAKAQV